MSDSRFHFVGDAEQLKEELFRSNSSAVHAAEQSKL
jgi:hypothetical protein